MAETIGELTARVEEKIGLRCKLEEDPLSFFMRITTPRALTSNEEELVRLMVPTRIGPFGFQIDPGMRERLKQSEWPASTTKVADVAALAEQIRQEATVPEPIKSKLGLSLKETEVEIERRFGAKCRIEEIPGYAKVFTSRALTYAERSAICCMIPSGMRTWFVCDPELSVETKPLVFSPTKRDGRDVGALPIGRFFGDEVGAWGDLAAKARERNRQSVAEISTMSTGDAIRALNAAGIPWKGGGYLRPPADSPVPDSMVAPRDEIDECLWWGEEVKPSAHESLRAMIRKRLQENADGLFTFDYGPPTNVQDMTVKSHPHGELRTSCMRCHQPFGVYRKRIADDFCGDCFTYSGEPALDARITEAKPPEPEHKGAWMTPCWDGDF